MSAARVLPFGTWPSPITAERVARGAAALGEVLVDGDATTWLESRPQEQGRHVVVRADPWADPVDVTPPSFSVRTRVHEYGGGSYTAPWPEAADLWHERSPVRHAERISNPVLILQGDEDEVVPPSQAEVIVRALEERGVPYAYLRFEGEQHGFRKVQSVARALEAELSFYGSVLGFEPADDLPALEIRHLPEA